LNRKRAKTRECNYQNINKEILNNEEITMNTYRVGTIKGLTAYTDIQRDYEHYKDKMKKINQAADQQELDISCYELANEGKVKAVLQESCAKVITESEMKAYLKKICENNKDGIDSILNPVQESIDSEIAQGKKRSPVLTGILVGAGTALKAMTVDIVTGLCGHIQKLYNDPEKTLKDDGKTLALIGKLTSIPKTPEDMKIQEQVYGKIWEDIRGGFIKEVLNGSSYTRAKYISSLTVTVGSFFIGAEEISGAGKVGKVAETASKADKLFDGIKEGENVAKVTGKEGEVRKEAKNFSELEKLQKEENQISKKLWEEDGKIDPEVGENKNINRIIENSSNLGKGAYNGNVYDGSGFGNLIGKNINVTEKGINIVKQHLSGEFFDITNEAMIKRLENALTNGETISGADASFYMHEITEATLMNQGMNYDVAHALALEKYDVSPFSVYNPEVIKEYPDLFSRGFKKYWDIN